MARGVAAEEAEYDVLHRAGKLPGAKAGIVPGHETAGEVIAVGPEVTTHVIGDRVVIYQRRFCGQCRNCLRGRQDMCRALGAPAVDTEGGYAEFVCVPANMGIKIPAGVDWEGAALSCCPIGTSLRALKAVAVSMLIILLYIAFRFEFGFGMGAMVSTLHDISMTIGVFVLTGHKFNAPMVAAILCVVGYSIN